MRFARPRLPSEDCTDGRAPKAASGKPLAAPQLINADEKSSTSLANRKGIHPDKGVPISQRRDRTRGKSFAGR